MKVTDLLGMIALPETGNAQSPPIVGARLLNKDVRVYCNKPIFGVRHESEVFIKNISYYAELDELVITISGKK